MMYLKQFPDICREMGFDVEEKAKTIAAAIEKVHGMTTKTEDDA